MPLIEEAARIVKQADIFAIVGTSLVVYPAAGLVNYAPPSVPKYIIDKKVPYTAAVNNLTVIEKPATEGVKELMTFLQNW